MNVSLTRTLLLAISVAATGATVMAVLSGSPAPAPTATALHAVPAADEAIVMLPTVHVVPDPTPTLLATVTVRPHAMPDDVELADFAVVIDYAAAAPSGGGTGMPYYSFGKSMHRAYRE